MWTQNRPDFFFYIKYKNIKHIDTNILTHKSTYIKFLLQIRNCSVHRCPAAVSMVSTKTATEVTSFTCGIPPLQFQCPRKRSWRTYPRGRTVASRPSGPSHKNDCRTTSYSSWNWIDDVITCCDRNDSLYTFTP